MVSLAAGLAREGHLPWVYSIAPFLAFRPYEQIRTDVCLHELPVKLVGNGGGYGYGIMGATHHALEDVGAMRVLPNMRLYVPLIAADVGEVVPLMAEDPLPNYLRLNTAARSRERFLASRRGEGSRAAGPPSSSVWGRCWAICTRWATRICSTISRSGAWGRSPSRRFPPTSSRASKKSGVS